MLVSAIVAAVVIAAPPQDLQFEGLGKLDRKVTTSSALAQKYFNQGLAFLYAFNHDEAIRSFKAAAEADPDCAMAWWGIATANGPHINNPMVDEEHAKAAWDALARARAGKSSPVEKALIAAAGKRFANPQPADRSSLDKAYAGAMREVWRKFPKDPDVGALFAEAMMDLRPWNLWRRDGSPQPGTLEIVATLRKVIALDKNHPLANHLFIHAVEGSPHPEWAVPSADRLRDLQPGLGHMVHMPSHIDVRTGNWEKAIVANSKAIAADAAYRAKVPKQGFYRVYMAHNQHMLAFAAMMRGRSALAISHADAMLEQFPEEWLKEAAPLVDGYMAMPMEVRVRFGKWDDVLAVAEFPDHFPIARALRHAARGIAFAAKGDSANARLEQSLYYASRRKVPAGASFGNNQASDILLVATHLLNGEILLGERKLDASVAELRKAVAAEDQLRYDEPPDWIQPTRHTLGAVLLSMKRFSDAEAVYREDLRRLPNNGWALYGLWKSLEGQGRAQAAQSARARFDSAWADADIKIGSSCLCVPGG
jgi:tetratricopeptide (TPR) repeat protein